MKQYKFDHYYLYGELTACLEELERDYPRLLKLESICTTPGGRQVWACTITNAATGDALSKPAYYVDGLHHAGEVTGSMAALHFAVTLVQGYGTDPAVTRLLDTSTVYIIPRISPDGGEAYLTSPEKLRSVDRPYPYEKRAPGLHAKDMDGDGVIRLMRIETPSGTWKACPEDSRVMMRRSPSDVEGKFYDLYAEGDIQDFDGVNIFPAEDKWALDFNRNYPYGWFPEARQPGAGKYPLSNPEIKAVADFVIAHPNICAAVSYHTSGGMYIYPPGTKHEKDAEARDMRMFRELGAMATQETGYGCYNIFDDFLTDQVNYSSGAFDDWMYQTQGIPTYTAELWDLAARSGIPDEHPKKPETPQQQLRLTLACFKWLDEHVPDYPGGCPIKPWTAFDHPQLGRVEIGSADFKFTFQNCPPGYLEQEVEKNTRAQLRLAQALPHLAIDTLESVQQAPGVYRVTALVSNSGYLPTFVCDEAKNLRTDRPLKATVRVAGELLAGQAETELGHLEGFSAKDDTMVCGDFYDQAKTAPTRKQLCYVVKAQPGTPFTLTVHSPRVGRVEATITL